MGDGERDRHDQQQGRDAEPDLSATAARSAQSATWAGLGSRARQPAAQSSTIAAAVVIASTRWSNCTAATFANRLRING